MGPMSGLTGPPPVASSPGLPMSEPKVSGEVGNLRIRRVDGAEMEEALSMLLTGRPGRSGAAVDQFRHYAQQQRLDLNRLWVGYAGSRPVAAALLVPGAGRTALAFVSPLIEPAQIPSAAAVLRSATSELDPAGTRIVQVLVDPNQALESQALLEAGFRKLAHLLYMERSTTGEHAPLRLEGSLCRLAWSPANRDAFAQAILASYEQTLDCPGLVGLRTIDDIIEGHMSTGQFVPELWLTIREGEEPVAVMLLNALPARRALELVYLGVSLPYRGRQWGRRLVDHALHVAHARGDDRLLLAVDEHNTPALRLYRAMGFRPTTRRTALILPLP